MYMMLTRFPGSSVGKESAYNAGDPGSIPESGRSTGEGIRYPLQYSGLENSRDCVVQGVTESNMTERLSLTSHIYLHTLSVHSFTGWHFSCFYFLTVVNIASKNMYVHVFEYLFSILWGIYLGVELLSHKESLSHYLRNYQTVFQNSCTILHSQQHCMGVSVYQLLCQHLSSGLFFLIIVV